MAKVTLDWKAPSEKKMAEYVKTLGEDKMKSFAKTCVEKSDDDKVSISKSKAKKWLVENCNEKDIEWKNKPKNVRPISGAEEIASWLNL